MRLLEIAIYSSWTNAAEEQGIWSDMYTKSA